MKLGTSTNLLFGRPDGSFYPLDKSLELMHEVGFNSFDLNGYDWALPGSPFLTEGWESWINSVAQKADDLCVTFDQCHSYFYSFLSPTLTDDKRKRHELLQARSFECCNRLGAKTLVLHPETDYSGIDITKQSYAKNREFFNRILEQTAGCNTRIAIENMCDYGIAPRRKFCAYPEELMDFVESFKDSRIGICWDFEHAYIMEQDQRKALLHIGSKLYATHVSDTHSKTDSTLMHVLPMSGGIDYVSIMQTLKQINYNNVFCLEVHNYANSLPDEVLKTAMKLAYEIGSYIMSLT